MPDRAAELMEITRLEQLMSVESRKIRAAAGWCPRGVTPPSCVSEREQELGIRRLCIFCSMAGAVQSDRNPRGRQRYRFHPKVDGGCGWMFTALAEVPLGGMKRHYERRVFLEANAPKLQSLRTPHIPGDVGGSRKTLFCWRNQFPQALRVDDQAALIGGLVEANEVYFRGSFGDSLCGKCNTPPADQRWQHRRKSGRRTLSNEKIPVVVTTDQKRYSRQARSPERKGSTSLSGEIIPISVLCIVERPGYRRVAKKEGLEYLQFGNVGIRRHRMRQAFPRPPDHLDQPLVSGHKAHHFSKLRRLV